MRRDAKGARAALFGIELLRRQSVNFREKALLLARALIEKSAIASRNGKLLVFRFGTQGLGQKLDLLHALGFITDRLKMLRIDVHQHEIAIDRRLKRLGQGTALFCRHFAHKCF